VHLSWKVLKLRKSWIIPGIANLWKIVIICLKIIVFRRNGAGAHEANVTQGWLSDHSTDFTEKKDSWLQTAWLKPSRLSHMLCEAPGCWTQSIWTLLSWSSRCRRFGLTSWWNNLQICSKLSQVTGSVCKSTCWTFWRLINLLHGLGVRLSLSLPRRYNFDRAVASTRQRC